MTLTTWGLALGAFMLVCAAGAGLARHFAYQDEAQEQRRKETNRRAMDIEFVEGEGWRPKQ